MTPNANINSSFGNLFYNLSTKTLANFSQLDFTLAIIKWEFGLHKFQKACCKTMSVDKKTKINKFKNEKPSFSVFKYVHQLIDIFLLVNDSRKIRSSNLMYGLK